MENQIPVVILAIWLFINRNKNTLTGPVNCKKTTRHHAHLLLCAKSRKTNDAKSRKWPKTSIWAIFGQIQGQISPNCKSFWKIGFIQIEAHILSRFWEKYESVWFWANLETFSRISPNQDFFSKIRLSYFSTFIVP